MTIHDTDVVFGISRGLPLTYVHRDVDDIFVKHLRKQKHIVLFGSSKQGKTSLISQHLDAGQYIAINCEKNRTLDDIYLTLLKAAGFEVETNSAASTSDRRKISGKASILSMLGLSTEKSTTSEQKIQKEKLPFDIANVHDVIDALRSVHFNKYFILEDFHYLSENIQEQFAYHLKIFNERSNFIFIILGVWPSQDRFARYNGDLSGRLCNINLDNWSNADMLKVISKGENLLNIKISDGAKEFMVESSFGSIAVLQVLCLEYCLANSVRFTQHDFLELGHDVQVAKILAGWIDKQNLRFNNFLRKIIRQSDPRLQMYKFIILSAIISDAETLLRGISLKAAFEIISSFASNQSITTLELEAHLLHLKTIQIENNIIPFLFEYDDEKQVLHINDKFLLIWLANKNRFESMAELDIDDEVVMKYMINRF